MNKIRQLLADIRYRFIDSPEIDKHIKEKMTEAEARRAVQRMSGKLIAKRAQQLYNDPSLNLSPTQALDQARAEWKREYGGFR